MTTTHRRLTVAEDADGAGRVAVYLPALECWRLLPVVDAQAQIENGDAQLEGPVEAPIDCHERTRAHYAALDGGRAWRPTRPRPAQ